MSTYTGSKAQSGRSTVVAIGPRTDAALPTPITGSTTSGSPTVTALSATTGLAAGQSISGTGIPVGATIVSVDTGASTLVLSANATATGSAVTLTLGYAYTPIFELADAPRSGNKWNTEDVTNFNSGVDMEFRKTIRDNGNINLAGNRVSTDAGQQALVAAYNDADGAYLFQISYPKESGQTTKGDVDSFAAIVESFDIDLSATKIVKIKTGLKVSGAITTVEGA